MMATKLLQCDEFKGDTAPSSFLLTQIPSISVPQDLPSQHTYTSAYIIVC